MRRLPLVVAALLLGASPMLALPAVALELPSPTEQRAQDLALLAEVGARADRRLVSVVPGPVRNEEVVLVGLGASGVPDRVLVEQRLTLTGQGDYQVRERGPARASEALGGEPAPVTKFGAVVWQGFSPGTRELAARLTLDPVLEAPRLPLQVAISGPVGPGGEVTGAGSVVLTLTNATSQPATLPTGTDAPAPALAAALDAALAVAEGPAGPRLPAAGAGLPAAVPAAGEARAPALTGVPLRISGSLLGGAVTGPGVTSLPGGAEVAGTLAPGASAELRVEVDGSTRLDLDLTAVPALDDRDLQPPSGVVSWAAWASAGPSAEERRQALDLLVATAATGARATSYSPYLGADLPGTGTTAFRYAFAQPEAAQQAIRGLEPRRGAIALTALAVLLLAANGALIWRRS
ncbi:MAG: hypothetical protein JWM62_2008 [Frankiales bacterium]|nr:hypothetical protein [Frankiales bacterium]